jgi:Xaa-Pro aminopeptidase
MSPVLHGLVERSIGTRTVLETGDGIAVPAGARKRPREVSMIKASCAVLDAAVHAFRDGWRGGAPQGRSPELGALEGERRARAMAAQDVRALVSLNGGRTLVPFQGQFEAKTGPLVGYIAVKFAGYWSDMLITESEPDGEPSQAARRTDLALDAILSAARPGVAMSALHAVATKSLAPLQLHPGLAGSVGRAIGLSLHEGPEFRADESAVLEDGGIYALQVGAADPEAGYAVKSAIIRLRREGADVLTRSPNVARP